MAEPSFADVLTAEGGLTAVYQPIVDLETEVVLGFEALVRGPAGSALESPAALLATARADGRSAEFDWACRRVAIRARWLRTSGAR